MFGDGGIACFEGDEANHSIKETFQTQNILLSQLPVYTSTLGDIKLIERVDVP